MFLGKPPALREYTGGAEGATGKAACSYKLEAGSRKLEAGS